MYTIKQVAQWTGISVPVLRAWERRYGVVEPARTASGYRLYVDADVRRLSAMQRLVAEGWLPSAAATAIREASDTRLNELVASEGRRFDPTAETARGDASALVARFVEAAGAFDTQALEATLDDMFAAGSYEAVVGRELMPALRALGEAWSNGRIDVASEHLASHAMMRRLATAFDAASRPAPAKDAVIVGLPPGARHELGALAFAVAARRAGIPIRYVGSDVPLLDWEETVRRTVAAGVVVAIPTLADRASAEDVVARLTESSQGVVVAVGGPGAPHTMPAKVLRLPEDHVRAVDALATALAGSR